MNSVELEEFRELCARCGLAVTHQRQVIYETLRSMPGHPNPEEVYARVRRRIPSISLATVYKNINVFVESGLFREVSPHHGSMRIEINSSPHHHLVCTRCRRIEDISEEELGGLAPPGRLRGGFLAERFSIDVLGLCAACQNARRERRASRGGD